MPGRVSEGSPEPLGLTLDGTGANVAVYSAHAAAVELCLFDEKGDVEIERLRLPARTGGVFHGHFEGIAAGQRYGLRAYGPYAPKEGHCFNPAKLLADPYALALDRPFDFSPAMAGFQADAIGEFRPDDEDSAPFMPKAIAMAPLPAKPRPHTKRPWPIPSSTSCTFAASPSCTWLCRRRSAAPSRGWLTRRQSGIWSSSA